MATPNAPPLATFSPPIHTVKLRVRVAVRCLRALGTRSCTGLTAVLLRRRIWSLNVGENFQVSLGAWQQFAVRPPAHLEVQKQA